VSTTLADLRSSRRVEPSPIFTPSAETIGASQLTAFIGFCERTTGRAITDSEGLYGVSVEDFQLFWQLFLSFSNLAWDGDAFPVCTDENVESARFFPNVQLSYVENLLRCETAGDLERPAITSRDIAGVTERLTRGELRRRVLEFAGALRALDVGSLDRVVSVLRNDTRSVVACLGVATVGATFSSASPEMGVSSVVSRFAQLNPVVLIVSSIGAPGFEIEKIRELAGRLPSLRSIVVFDDSPISPGFPLPVHRSCDFPQAEYHTEAWTRYPFNHPLFILFSSGTTGLPKCIVHGAGGTLLEHMKEHLLHGDLHRGDKLFFHTSAAWMMWNWQLSALACGAEIVLYDGPVVDPEVLWRIVAEEHVTVFGTSPPYLRMCQIAGYSPAGCNLDLTSLRAIMSTGAILYEDQFYWVRDKVGQIPLQSISGGTDIVGCFVLGNPNLPVYAGELQCRSFGLDVRALVPEGASNGCWVGDLICANPFPSRPLGFHGDSSGKRFHAAYFSRHAGVWTHGDLIEITPRGTARMHGRTDGTMNVRGIRIGPAEIYRILGSFAEIQESMAVEQVTRGGASDSRMVLLVVMNEGHSLDPPLRARIRTALAREASPAHIPAVIVDVPELPLTHSGKRSEVAAREALKGDRPANVEALRNPHCLQAIRDRVAAHDARAARPMPPVTTAVGTLEEELTGIWERVLGTSPIGPHDDFFEAGGTSLLTAPLFQQIADRLGRRLPLSTILHAPTISSLAALLRDDPGETWGSLELLKPGNTQRPLFIAPGLLGEPLGLRPLAQHISTDRAVYGLRTRGLIQGEQPIERTADMADAHLPCIQTLQRHGPYSLLGYSSGGAVVVEIARRLINAGESVDFVGLIDTHSAWACLRWYERLAQAIRLPLRWPRALTVDLALTLRNFKQRLGIEPTLIAQNRRAVRVIRASRRALKSYRPEPYPGALVYFKASIPSALQFDATLLWSRLTRNLLVHRLPGHHYELLNNRVVELARLVTASLPPDSDQNEPKAIKGRSRLADRQSDAVPTNVHRPNYL